MIYGQIVLNVLADKEIISKSEGILYSEFEVLREDVLKLVSNWNHQKLKTSVEAKEPYSIIDGEDFSDL